jgi:hypothetical protein
MLNKLSHTFIQLLFSEVSIAVVLLKLSNELNGREVRIPAGAETFSSSKPSRPFRVPPGLLFSKYWDSFPEQKKAGREFDHSPPPTIEVENKWSCTYTPAVCLHDTNRDTFTSSSFIVKICQSDIGFKRYAFWRVSPSRQNICSSKFPSIIL